MTKGILISCQIKTSPERKSSIFIREQPYFWRDIALSPFPAHRAAIVARFGARLHPSAFQRDYGCIDPTVIPRHPSTASAPRRSPFQLVVSLLPPASPFSSPGGRSRRTRRRRAYISLPAPFPLSSPSARLAFFLFFFPHPFLTSTPVKCATIVGDCATPLTTGDVHETWCR